MIVFRVCKVDAERWERAGRFCWPAFWDDLPCPQDEADDLMQDVGEVLELLCRHNWICGGDEEQIPLWWDPESLEIMYEVYGNQLVVLEVPDEHVRKFRKQLIFNPECAKLVRALPLHEAARLCAA